MDTDVSGDWTISTRKFNKSIGWQRKNNFLAKILFILQYNLLSARNTESNDLLTFWCLSCNKISQGLQNSHSFPIWSLHLTKISVHGAISLSLGTDKSRSGSNLENRLDGEAIQNAIHWFLQSFLSICELVHCLARRWTFPSTNEAVFLLFLVSISPTMHSNSHCWFFSFFHIVDKQYATGIQKNRSHNVSSWLLCLCSLWSSSTGCYPLFCLLFRSWYVVVDSRFINGH